MSKQTLVSDYFGLHSIHHSFSHPSGPKKRKREENEESEDQVKKQPSPTPSHILQSPEKKKSKTEDSSMLKYLKDDGWKEVLKSEFSRPYFKKIERYVEEERKTQVIYPPEDEVFTAFNLTPWDNVKVVLLGQGGKAIFLRVFIFC